MMVNARIIVLLAYNINVLFIRFIKPCRLHHIIIIEGYVELDN